MKTKALIRDIGKFLIVFAICIAFRAFADSVTDPVTPGDFWSALLALVGNLKGMTGLAITTAVVQLVMLLLRSGMVDALVGSWKLVVVTGLSVVGAVLTGLSSGMSLVASIFTGAVLAAAQVFVNEVIKHFKPSGA